MTKIDQKIVGRSDESVEHLKIERFETEYWKRMPEAKIKLYRLKPEIYKAKIPEQEPPP